MTDLSMGYAPSQPSPIERQYVPPEITDHSRLRHLPIIPTCECGGIVAANSSWGRTAIGTVVLGEVTWVCDGCSRVYAPGDTVLMRRGAAPT